ncbi:MAG TPA: ATP-binding protein [Candidatus Aminicenantes bacterium]|nr:ATP-binding protein [Candidatus Aminicenantes bacterium]
MGQSRRAFVLSLIAGALVLVVSVFGFVGMLGRPDIPWDELAQQTGVPAEDLPGLALRVDGFPVVNRDADFKFVAARHRVGDEIEFVFAKNGGEVAARAALEAHYAGEGYPLVFFLTGMFGFVVGFAVYVLRRVDRRAGYFFWLCLAFSAAVMINGEWYGVQGRPLAILPGVVFFFAYTLTPIAFLKFALTLTPRDRLPGGRALFWLSILFGASFSAAFAASILLPSVAAFRYKGYFRFFRVWFIVLLVAGTALLARAFRTAPSRVRRGQIRWVLAGVLGGLGPFLFLYQLPRALGAATVLGEEAASAFFVLLPLALALAIFKYRLLDVPAFANKSVVYALLTAVTVGVYMLAVEAMKPLFAVLTGAGRKWLPAGAAFIAALAFAPARAWIQKLVDRAFYRRGYNERRALRAFAERAGKAWSAGDVLAVFGDVLAETLPVERVGAFVPSPGRDPSGAALRAGLDDEAAAALLAAPAGSPAPLSRVRLERLGFEVALPLAVGEGAPHAWLFVGPKRSGLPFTAEDRTLLEALAAEAAEAFRRVRLQEEVVYERASREKAEELGRMKTEFISTVSHELKTPMTSLRSISELLKSGKVADPERRGRLLELMAGECGRLGRYLHNVLDFGRIEQDAKSYDIRETDLVPVVAGVVEIVRPAAAEEGLALVVSLPYGPVPVEADAVRQAVFNLVDNAFKYSTPPKRVAVSLAPTAAGAEIAVSDSGIGVAPAERERLFDAFFRGAEARRLDLRGVGLGLMIVKHVMDAHGGEVAVSGEPGRGATFTLRFPRRRAA